VSSSYRIKPKARDDLDEYALYLVEKGTLDLALRFLDKAEETFELLATQPGIGWRAHRLPSSFADVRICAINSFPKLLVFYRPVSNSIEVLRVLHGSRSLRALLRRERLD
jgi:plasmid stabilization system protein ParE